MLPLLKRFGKAALAIELSAIAGLYWVFRDINTGGPEARERWDRRAPWIIDAFHTVTGDERVIEHRRLRASADQQQQQQHQQHQQQQQQQQQSADRME